MAIYTKTYTFADGTSMTASGDQVQVELTALGASVNSIVNDQVSASAAIVDSKLSIPNRLKQSQRQGGSATDWNTTGTSTQTVTNPVIQTGVGTTGSQTFSSPNYFSTLNITFPTAYTNKPIVVPWLANVGGTMAFGAAVSSVTTTGCTITVNSGTDGYVANSVVGWIAIGT